MYYEGLLATEEDKLERAAQLADQQQKAWMKEAIWAEIARKQGNGELEKQHQQKAVDSTRGVQRYLLVKKYGVGVVAD